MSLTLHLGVIDQPHQQPVVTRKGALKKSAKKGVLKSAGRAMLHGTTTLTTGDLAGILEAKYHPMRLFFELKAQKVAEELEKGLVGTLENLLVGGPVSANPFGDATSNIDDMFKQFLSNKEMERLGYPGVPTKAALRGVDHRKLHPYAKRGPRPSFIDTGLYQSSFKSWVD